MADEVRTCNFSGAFLKLPALAPLPVGPTTLWGTFTRYLAIGDDKFAIREVDTYENGNGLVYDRDVWYDEFGGLTDIRFDEHWLQLWGEPMRIAEQDFELALKLALASPSYVMQVASAKRAKKTTWPVPHAWQHRRQQGI